MADESREPFDESTPIGMCSVEEMSAVLHQRGARTVVILVERCTEDGATICVRHFSGNDYAALGMCMTSAISSIVDGESWSAKERGGWDAPPPPKEDDVK